MMNTLDNSHVLPSNSKRKSYSAMKVLQLGSLTDLTQRNDNGTYADATNMMVGRGASA